jgi:hypothetical protein
MGSPSFCDHCEKAGMTAEIYVANAAKKMEVVRVFMKANIGLFKANRSLIIV